MKTFKIHNYILYIFVFLLHFEYWGILNIFGNFTVTKLIGYFYFLFAVLDYRHFFAIKWLKTFLIPILSFFLLLTYISFAYSTPGDRSSDFLDLQTLQCIIMFWIVSNHLRSDKQIMYNAVFAFILGGLIMCVLYLLDVGFTTTYGRVMFFGEGSNTIGLRIAIVIFIFIGLVIENPLNWGKRRFILLGLLFIMFPVLIASGSRTALASFVISVLLLILFSKITKFYKIIIIIAFVFIGYYLFQEIMQNEAFLSRINKTIEEGDTAHRTDIWKQILPIFYGSPIFGVGITGYYVQVIAILKEFKLPHNVYMEVLSYTGILGAWLFILFIYRLLKVGLKVYKFQRIIFPTILLLMILTIFTASHGLYTKSYWFLYAMIFAFGSHSEIEANLSQFQYSKSK